jgi:NADPH-dependent curcumin reductase CurA
VLCGNIILSIDPAARARIQGRTCRAQVLPGEVMPGFTLSEVIESPLVVSAAEMATLIAEGGLRVVEEVHDRVSAAPAALVGLLAGKNTGKHWCASTRTLPRRHRDRHA